MAKSKRELELAARFPQSLTVAVELTEFQVGDRKVGTDERKELLRALRAGDVFTLSVNAKTFLQPNVPIPLPKRLRARANANFSRFKVEELSELAESFAGRRFLRDHNVYSMAAVGGEIIESQLVERSEEFQFRQVLHLVKPWAIEDALDGTMSTFSIGWRPRKGGWEGFRESLLCSVCDACFFDCSHYPGDVVKRGNSSDGEEELIVEAIWTKVRGAETSEVSFPAVSGTEVRDIRAALSELRAQAVPRKERDVSADEILKALGLSEKATSAEAVGAIGKLHAANEQARTDLATERAAHETTRDQLAKERGARALETKQRHEAEVARLREEAIGDGRLIPDDDSDKLFGELAAEDLERGKRYLATLKRKTPVGQPMRAPGSGPTRAQDEQRKKSGKLSERQKRINAEMGLSDEEFLKYDAMASELAGVASDGDEEGEE